MIRQEWSIKEIQDIVLEGETWQKKALYATDSEKCSRGIYYALLGEPPTNPIDPKGSRRMEVGQMIEMNQVKKLKSLGIFLTSQFRIYDEEHNVSGRPDALIISPIHCTEEAKELISKKKEIFSELQKIEREFWESVNGFESGEIDLEEYRKTQYEVVDKRIALYQEDKQLSEELLKPNPDNHLMLIEIKSIAEAGFKWLSKDGAKESHKNQLMFYLWKLREKYPNLVGRILYVETTYQGLMEFNLDFDQNVIDELKKKWKYLNECVGKRELPPAAPSIVYNSKTRRWQVNYQADWCRWHIKCTEDPSWLAKAIKEVQERNKR